MNLLQWEVGKGKTTFLLNRLIYDEDTVLLVMNNSYKIAMISHLRYYQGFSYPTSTAKDRIFTYEQWEKGIDFIGTGTKLKKNTVKILADNLDLYLLSKLGKIEFATITQEGK
jgi:hypothetical protein